MCRYIVTLCIVESQGWTREGYAPPQLVTFKVPDDGVRAEFIPSKGHGWQIFGQGKQTVGSQVLCGYFWCTLCD